MPDIYSGSGSVAYMYKLSRHVKKTFPFPFKLKSFFLNKPYEILR